MASIPLKMDVGIVGLSHPERAASGSGIWGRRIAFRSRAEEWSQKIEKNAMSCRCEVGRKSDVASPLASEIGGEIVITEDPFVIQEPLLGKHPNPKNVAAIILGGGPGTHLFPLTRTRATPAGIKELGISTPQLIDFAIERALSTSPSILLSLLPCCYQYRMNHYRHHDEELYWKGGPGIISSSLDFSLSFPILLPKVPVGGCYKLIDITMSNCINCGINKILVMTQYNSASLNRHISLTYNFGNGVNLGDGFIEVLAATQSPGETGMNWFQGTADAVRQFTWLFESNRRENIEYIVILSGDQLYRMDYMDFVQKHIESGADISLSCTPVDDSRASDYGIVKIDKQGRINQFFEKPKDADLESMKDDDTLLRLPHQDLKKYPYMASMGVYVFNRNILLELLRWTYPKANDFGLDVLPFAVKSYNVQAYIFTDYWEDIGTIKSFFDANMALTDQPPKFQFYDPSTPIITLPRFLPPTKMEQCKVVDSIISDGCFFHNSSIQHSIVGVRSRIDYGAELKDTLMMGADTYETEREIALLLEEGKVPIGVGQNTQIRNCIIDMNARIGKNVIIANKNGVNETDRSSEGFYIRSGITIISKNATIKDGTVI